jgi:hypothetical protein
LATARIPADRNGCFPSSEGRLRAAVMEVLVAVASRWAVREVDQGAGRDGRWCRDGAVASMG